MKPRSIAEGHRCQQFSGVRVPDPWLPKKYQDDPWCWSPELGFHRSSDPLNRHRLTQNTGLRSVTMKSMVGFQAFRLGAGVGITNAGNCVSEFFERSTEITGGFPLPDIEPVAQFASSTKLAFSVADSYDGDGPAFRLAICRAAIEFFVNGLDDQWAGLVSSGLADTFSDEEARSAYDRSHAAYERWQDGDRTEFHGYAMWGLIGSLRSSDFSSGSTRTIARAFALCHPTPGDVVKWLDLISATALRNLAKINPVGVASAG